MNTTLHRRLYIGLGALQVFIGLGGIAGGIGLALDPTGAGQDIPLELLDDAPFGDYLIPGLVLLFVIGVGTFIGGVLSIRRCQYAGEVAVVLGALLMVWIVAQIWWIGLVHWLQPFYFGFGLVQLVLGLVVWSHSSDRVEGYGR